MAALKSLNNKLLYYKKSYIYSSSCLFRDLSTSCTIGNWKHQKTPTLLLNVDSQFLIDKYHFSQETVSKLSHLLKNSQRTHSILEFLKETGFSNTQLEKVVRSIPTLVSRCLLIRIKSKIKCFQDFGFSSVEIAEIVSSYPAILGRSAINKIIPSLSVLKGLLGSNAHVAELLTRPGWVIGTDFEKGLLPNLEFLKSCGVGVEQINAMLRAYPNFFVVSPENMRRCVDKVDEMGVDRSSKLFIHAVKVVSSMSDESWQLKLKTFRELGFSEDGIVRVFRSNPTVFAVSGQKIRKVKEVLLETGKYDLSSIRDCPVSLISSVEKRYKPRLQILKDLEKKGLISKWPRLSTLRTIDNNTFHMRYVALLGDEVGQNGKTVPVTK